METDDIVPKILTEVPSLTITVTYPNNKQVELGKELTPTDVKEEPTVKWDADSEKYYTLVMIDPDAPSKKYPILGEVNHWMVANIKGCDLSTGDVMAGYGGAGPPKYTGLHRYIFLVFEHADKLTFDEKKIPQGTIMPRIRFSIKKFRDKYKFDKVFAWNYFKAQWESHVAEPNQETRTCVCL